VKLERFGGGETFHRCQNKVKFWLMSMGLWWIIHPMICLTVPQATAYPTACDFALGCILTLLADNLYDIYMDYKDPNKLWDALERKYAFSEDGHLLYICEQLFDFSINAAKSIVTQAHEFLLLAREIASLGCPIPDRVLAAGIIAKLPTSWRDFATCLKHKREDISTESLITTLDVEEKARAKDAPSTLSLQRMVLVQMLLLVKIITTTRIRERCKSVVSLRKPLTSRGRSLEKTIEHVLCVAKENILQKTVATTKLR
jgi:hypothetical protein